METEEKKVDTKNSAESHDFLCTTCKHKQKHIKAELFCVECIDHYCSSCVKVHEDVPSLFGHTIQNIQELQQKSSTVLPATPSERCEKHPHKLVDMYCRSHDTVSCAVCLTGVKHRLCRDIFYIPEFVENNDVASLQEGFQTKIESAIVTMAECQNMNQHKIQYLQAKKESLLENIAQFRNEINARLDELQDKTVSEIEEKMAALTEELNEKISNLEADIARMKSAQKKIGTASTNKSQAFVSTKIGLEVADKANYIGNEDKDPGHMEVPDFRGDQRILSLLKEIIDMGIMRPIYAQETDANNEINMADKSAPDKSNHPNADVTIANKETKESKENIVQSVSEHAEQSGQESAGGKKDLQFQIKGKKTVCTKVDSDCKKIDSQGIVSCCFMKNGKIVLCDYDNKKLKMLHRSTYEVTNQFDLPGLPWQLCAISDNSIAVSLGKLREIQYFSLHYHIQKSSSFSTDHNCYGLAYANNNLYVSDSDTYIYIYSEFGIKLKQVTNTLLKSPSFINSWLDISLKNLAVNDDGSRIFITHPTNGLIMH